MKYFISWINTWLLSASIIASYSVNNIYTQENDIHWGLIFTFYNIVSTCKFLFQGSLHVFTPKTVNHGPEHQNRVEDTLSWPEVWEDIGYMYMKMMAT